MMFFLYFLFTYSIGHLGSLSHVKLCHTQPPLIDMLSFSASNGFVTNQNNLLRPWLDVVINSIKGTIEDRVRILLEENVPYIFLEI